MRAAIGLPGNAILVPMPEFTAMTARQIAVLIQQRELMRRPELVLRRKILLETALIRANTPLRGFLAPGGYSGPDDFYPALAMLWFNGAEIALQAAYALNVQGEVEPLYALLLTADLFSGGGDTTLLFAANSNGDIIRREAVLHRNSIVPGRAYVTGVAAGGTIISFDGADYEALMEF
jgi:hypothetical protein